MYRHANNHIPLCFCIDACSLVLTFDRSGFSGIGGSTPRWYCMNLTTCARMSAFTPGIGTSAAVGSGAGNKRWQRKGRRQWQAEASISEEEDRPEQRVSSRTALPPHFAALAPPISVMVAASFAPFSSDVLMRFDTNANFFSIRNSLPSLEISFTARQ